MDRCWGVAVWGESVEIYVCAASVQILRVRVKGAPGCPVTHPEGVKDESEDSERMKALRRVALCRRIAGRLNLNRIQITGNGKQIIGDGGQKGRTENGIETPSGTWEIDYKTQNMSPAIWDEGRVSHYGWIQGREVRS